MATTVAKVYARCMRLIFEARHWTTLDVQNAGGSKKSRAVLSGGRGGWLSTVSHKMSATLNYLSYTPPNWYILGPGRPRKTPLNESLFEREYPQSHPGAAACNARESATRLFVHFSCKTCVFSSRIHQPVENRFYNHTNPPHQPLQTHLPEPICTPGL